MTVPIYSMDTMWLKLLRDVARLGVQTSPRGQLTRELLCSKIVVDARRSVVTIPSRRMGYRFMCAEAAWMLSGDDRVETIAPYSKEISKFSDDGVRFFGAYGTKLRAQLDHVVKCLEADPDSRQAVINIWRESPPPTKDTPCTLSCQLMIRNGTLHTFVTMRSSDIWLGVVYDIPSMAMWAAYVLLSLSDKTLRLGNVYNVAASRHLYERNIEGARECLKERTLAGTKYASLDVREFKGPDDLVEHLWRLARRERTPHRWLSEFFA